MTNWELEDLRWKLRNAREEIEILRIKLDREQSDHAATRHQRDELQAARNRAYDAYVTDTHEGYMPQEDYDDLEREYERLIECIASFMGVPLSMWGDHDQN